MYSPHCYGIGALWYMNLLRECMLHLTRVATVQFMHTLTGLTYTSFDINFVVHS